MSSKIIIKSLSNGLKVILDNECPFNEIVDDAITKFTDAKSFFKGVKTAVLFEGRKLSSDEEKQLIKVIEDSGEFTILYLIDKDTETNDYFIKLYNKPVQDIDDSSSIGKIYVGSLKKGDKIETESSIVILGDVEPGAVIMSGGSIIILGGLYGTAISDCEVNYEKSFIAAMDVSAESIKIGPHTYYSKEKPKWVVKPKMIPKLAYIYQSTIKLENVSKEAIHELTKSIKKS